MSDERVEIWHRPMAPVSQIVDKIEQECVNPPDNIELNTTLKGRGAQRFYFISKILENGFGLSQSEVVEYLIRLGVEQELGKLALAQAIGDKEK